MAINNKKKNIKDLDNVFKIIEKKENIEESEEQKSLKEEKKKEMKKIRLFLILILGLLLILTASYILFSVYESSTSQYAELKYKNRTSLIIRNVDETLLSNYLEKGKKTIVSFWASWCPHCKNEASALNEFMINNPNVNFILVSHDKDIDSISTYFKNNSSYKWFVIYDTQRTIRASIDPKASTIPRTYLLNDKGEVLDKIDGQASYDDLVNLINNN